MDSKNYIWKKLEIYLLSSHYPAQDFQMIKPFYCLNHSIVFSQFILFGLTIWKPWVIHSKTKKIKKLLSSYQCGKYISIATCFDILKIDIHRPNGRTDVICTSGTSCFLRRICSEKMKGKIIFFRTYLC